VNITDNIFVGKLVRLAAPKPEDHEIMAKWSDNVEFGRMGEKELIQPRSSDKWKDLDEQAKKSDHIFNFRIRTLTDNKLIGFIMLYVRWSHQRAAVIIDIGEPEYWGRGYGSDAMSLGVNYGFRELGLYKISLGVFSYNARAIRAYEKVGFVHEARQRAMLYRDGQRYDMLEMGIIRPEWEVRIKQQEA
jgi:RimJ/RimL family protein N-acetyltransferase